MKLIDKDALVAEIENIRKHYIERDDFDNGWNFALDKVLSFIDTQPKECMYSKDNYTDEDRKVLCDGCEEDCKYNKKEDVSDDLEKVVEEIVDPTVLNAYGVKEIANRLRRTMIDSVSDDLEEASKEWLRPQLDKSYANYGETKMMELTHFDGYAMLDAIEFGANWQKKQLMASGTDVTVHIEAGNYPYIPQIELYDYDKDIPLAKEGDKYKVVLIKEE